jgi:two-component system alkaline phosphatase synthesis response regulator PhoP
VVYYVEDDTNIRELTCYALAQAGIEAKGLADDASFRVACSERTPDAVLLDIMLPDVDGLQILRRIRRTPGLSRVPVMMLTAKDTELDTVCALDGGADDYLAKPFGMMEMVSRVRALLRRSPARVEKAPADADLLEAGPLAVSRARHEARHDGDLLELTAREFDLLAFLMASPGVAFTREDLLQRVWGWDFDGGSRTVDVHVQTLRRKLGADADLIETVRGVGYRLRDAPAGAEGDGGHER